MTDDFRPIKTIVVSTELSKENAAKANQILGQAPVVAMPERGWGPRATTVEDLIENLGSIVDYLKTTMTDLQGKNDQLLNLYSDMQAAGRIFKMMTYEATE